MKTATTIVFFFALLISGSSQDNFTYSVFFDSGKSIMNPAQQQELHRWIESIVADEKLVAVRYVNMVGHCDSIGDAKKNLVLSGKRMAAVAAEVKNYLPELEIQQAAEGEENPGYSNADMTGRASNRRVDISITIENKKSVVLVGVGNPSKDKKHQIAEKECDRDTTIIFPQGMTIRVNKCDYDKYFRDCPLKVTEYINGESIRESGLNTQSTEGEQLTTGGMFRIEWCSANEFPVPLDISLPVEPCSNTARDMYLWNQDPVSRNWIATNTRFNYNQDNSRRAVLITRPGAFNCDAVMSLIDPNVKFVGRNGLKIMNLRVYYECPNASVVEADLPEKKSVRRTKLPLDCPGTEPMAYARAMDRKGNIYYMHYIPLNDLDFRKRRAICGIRKKTTHHDTDFSSERDNHIAKKYYLKRKNFDMTLKA